jgi:hypothetical protein
MKDFQNYCQCVQGKNGRKIIGENKQAPVIIQPYNQQKGKVQNI